MQMKEREEKRRENSFFQICQQTHTHTHIHMKMLTKKKSTCLIDLDNLGDNFIGVEGDFAVVRGLIVVQSACTQAFVGSSFFGRCRLLCRGFLERVGRGAKKRKKATKN